MDSMISNVNQVGYYNLNQITIRPPHINLNSFTRTASIIGKLAITKEQQRLSQFLHHDVSMPKIRKRRQHYSGIDKKTQQEILSDAKNYIASLHPMVPAIAAVVPQDTSPLMPTRDYSADRLADLKDTIIKSNEVLAKATTVFPVTLFPDDLIVDRTKITIKKRNFFFVSEVMSIRIEDILNVKVSTGPFFGSLTLVVRILSSEDHHSVNYFWRKDAIHLKHLIQGYIIAHHNGIDCRDQPKEELIQTLSELGHDSST